MLETRGYTEILHHLMKFVNVSIEDLERRLKHKYSIGYLKRVLEGKPMPEVEKDIRTALINFMAEKVGRCLGKLSTKIGADKAAESAFKNVVMRRGLELPDIALLTTETCQWLTNREVAKTVKRMNTMDVTDVTLWERQVEDILKDLFQGKLFVEEDEILAKDRVSRSSISAKARLDKGYVLTDYFRLPPSHCWNCSARTADLNSSRCGCGVNWNIPD